MKHTHWCWRTFSSFKVKLCPFHAEKQNSFDSWWLTCDAAPCLMWVSDERVHRFVLTVTIPVPHTSISHTRWLFVHTLMKQWISIPPDTLMWLCVCLCVCVCVLCDSVGESEELQEARRQHGQWEYFRCRMWMCANSLTVTGVGKVCGCWWESFFSTVYFCFSDEGEHGAASQGWRKSWHSWNEMSCRRWNHKIDLILEKQYLYLKVFESSFKNHWAGNVVRHTAAQLWWRSYCSMFRSFLHSFQSFLWLRWKPESVSLLCLCRLSACFSHSGAKSKSHSVFPRSSSADMCELM